MHIFKSIATAVTLIQSIGATAYGAGLPIESSDLDVVLGGAAVNLVAVERAAEQSYEVEPDKLRVRSSDDSAGSYAPVIGRCPSDLDTLIRTASDISDSEKAFIAERQKQTNDYLVTYLDRLNMTDFDASSFLENTNLTIGIAFSGGGYRAMLCGAGFMAAFDDRTPNSTLPGHVGGLLQSATYVSGLSGGSWLVGTVAMNGWVPVVELQGAEDVWDLDNSIINPGGINIFSTAGYYDDLVDDVKAKKKEGFDISLTDYWGRGLAMQLLNYTDGGPNFTFSDVQSLEYFKNYSMPFPIIVSDGRAPGTKIISLNSTVFEFNPYELGSFDPSLYAFTQLKYIGTNVTNGVPNDKDKCVTNFDSGGFVIGTSSTLFNEFLLQINSSGITGVLYDAVYAALEEFDESNDDIAAYSPNPFYGVQTGTSTNITKSAQLDLVDGGEDYQNIPLQPLINPLRGLDVVFAIDNSADTDENWPAGWAMTATYDRQFGSQANGTVFPAVPDQNTFVGLNLTAHPTWFGCNSSNITNGYSPLIVYMANHPMTYFSNTSTYKMSYSTEEVAGIISNTYNVATQANGTIDTNWAKCLGCAIIHREVERRNSTHTDECQQCLKTYCWDGTVLTNDASNATESPSLEIGTSQVVSSGSLIISPRSAVCTAIVLLTAYFLYL
ncbi:lysophospholipase catalytic domain-containing protein [Dipodascopsis uninucleata]